MTVDVDPPFSIKHSYVIEKGVTYLLDLFNKRAINATFFVPAIVALNFPEVIEEIVEKGHEIGCHGFNHSLSEIALSLDKKTRMIRDATEIIESITGQKPVGFRAPFFKADRNCWIALKANNYVYDSSCLGSPLYQRYNVKRNITGRPFYIHLYSGKDSSKKLIEIPVSVNLIVPFPLGGGWLRIFGFTWAKIGVKMNLIFRVPTIFYIHPKDVVAYEPRGLPWYYYRNAYNSLAMLDKIIQYVRQNGAEFLAAYQLAKKFEDKHKLFILGNKHK